MRGKLWIDTKAGRKGLILMGIITVLIWVALLFNLT
jgi:hypothetical protein